MAAQEAFGIAQFFARFPDEEACLQHIFDVRYGTHTPCPACGQLGPWTRIKDTKKWRHACGKHISPLKGTVMYRSNLSLMAWFYAILLFANTSIGMRASFIRKQLGIGHKSSWRLCQLVRAHMASMPRPDMLGGEGKTVHIDEVSLRHIGYCGGRRNQAVIVMGFACEGQVLSAIVPDRTSKTLLTHIAARVRPGSTIVTDMLSGYHKLAQAGFEHVRINHSVAFHDFHGHTNNEIEAYWSTVRRMFRVARQASRENAWSFLAETEFKYNRRKKKELIFEELITTFPTGDPEFLSGLQARFDWT